MVQLKAISDAIRSYKECYGNEGEEKIIVYLPFEWDDQ
jgi:hypothetical protein